MAADFRAQLPTDLQTTFSLERELGGGGMSRVFLATENALGRRVVIKTVPGDMLSAAAAERFKREIVIDQILAPLRPRAATAAHAAARSPPSTRGPSGPGATRRPAAAHHAR